MTIRCKLCKHTMLSNKPPQEAPEDVLKQMSEHMIKAHRRPHMDDLAAAVSTLFALAGPHLLFQYVDMVEGESELRAAYEENRDLIFAILDGRPVRDPASQKKVVA